MRFGIVILILLGINSFVSAYVHSNVTYVLQPEEIKSFYLPEQTGSVGLKLIQGNNDNRQDIFFRVNPRASVQSQFIVSSARNTKGVFASTVSDTNDWYPLIVNQNSTSPITVTFELEVYETITAVGKTVNLPLVPYALQYVRIPAEINHGLSFRFEITECDTDRITIYAKSNSHPLLSRDYLSTTLFENEEVLVLIQNGEDVTRNCVLNIHSKPTVVLTNGLNTLTVNNTATFSIGTRYNPTSTSNNVLKIQTNPAVDGIYYDFLRAYYRFDNFYITDAESVQNFVFDTSNLNDGDQLNVTVTPIATALLPNGVKQSIQCVNSGDHHVFALIGSDKTGAVMKVIETESISQVLSYYVSNESPINDDIIYNGDSRTRYALSNGVVWVLEVVCSESNVTASITASLPVIQTLSIGKNVIKVGETDDVYAILPQGPDQTTLGIRANSTSISGWYAPYSYTGYDQSINNNLLTDIVYARDSPVVSPAWYFAIYSSGVAETYELTLTSIPVVTLESGKTHQFSRPNNNSYGEYVTVAKLESSNGLGHALSYVYEYDVNDNYFARVTVNGLVDTRSKKRDVLNDIYYSEFGNATYYFAVGTTSSPVNVTATFAPVSTAVNGIADFSHTAQAEEQHNSFHTFLFPAMKRRNSIFKLNTSSSVVDITAGFEGTVPGVLDGEPSAFFSLFVPDSYAVWFVTEVQKGQNATIHIESLINTGLCNVLYDCNGHGSCATMADQCTCTDGYSGDWCDVPPSPPTPSDDNNNSGADQLMAVTCQLFIAVVILLIAF